MMVKNNIYTKITYVALILILVIGLVGLGIINYRTEQELKSAQASLVVTQETLKTETEKCLKLNEELEIANTIIDSLKSDEYIVGTTVTNKEIEMIAQTVWGEARGQDTIEKAAVVWCILNRVDVKNQSIAEVITSPNQFVGYSKNNPVTDELVDLTRDVIMRWKMEKVCVGEVGRVLPHNYLWFRGYDGDNHFRNAYNGDYNIWDWNCWNPYK